MRILAGVLLIFSVEVKADNLVSLAKLSTLPANSLIGNNTGSAATPLALTLTQSRAWLQPLITTAKTANYTILGTDSVVPINNSSAFTITMPDPVANAGLTYCVPNVGTGTSLVTFNPYGSEQFYTGNGKVANVYTQTVGENWCFTSNSVDWLTMHSANTSKQAFTFAVITSGTPTAAVLGTNTNGAYWRRVGDHACYSIWYKQTVGGTTGSTGTYEMTVPFSAVTTDYVIGTTTVAYAAYSGLDQANDSWNTRAASVGVYDATHLFMTDSIATWNTANGALNNTTLNFSFNNACVHITNWSP